MSNNNEGNDDTLFNNNEARNAEQVNSDRESLRGYCHVCDRQVEIDKYLFTCTQCYGGFIELFEMENNNQASLPNETSATSQQTNQSPIRLESIDTSNLGSLFPLLLPHLFNPNLISSLQNPTGASIAQNTETASDLGSSNLSGQNSASTSVQPLQQQQSQFPHHVHHIRHHIHHPQRGGGPSARLQFIVPGEEIDFYGIMNNVLTGLLDPQAAALPQNTQFHIQAPPIRMFQLHGNLRDYAWGASGLDTIITQLLNQLDNTGPPPATEEQLKNLPVVKINQEEFEKNVQCSICMEDFQLDEEAKKLPCKHYFHPACITEWLKLHGTCPVCRKNLNGEDTSQREYVSRPPNTNTTESTSSEPSATSEPIINPSDIRAEENVPTLNSSEQTSTQSSNANSGNGTNNNNNNSNNNSRVYYDMDFD